MSGAAQLLSMASLGLGHAKRRREISRDKVPCTRMAAVVEAQRDRARGGVTLIYFQRKLTGIYFTVSVRTPAFYSLFRSFLFLALSRRAETREQEARTWRIFYGKNGDRTLSLSLFLSPSLSFLRSRPWSSRG